MESILVLFIDYLMFYVVYSTHTLVPSLLEVKKGFHFDSMSASDSQKVIRGFQFCSEVENPNTHTHTHNKKGLF